MTALNVLNSDSWPEFDDISTMREGVGLAQGYISTWMAGSHDRPLWDSLVSRRVAMVRQSQPRCMEEVFQRFCLWMMEMQVHKR